MTARNKLLTALLVVGIAGSAFFAWQLHDIARFNRAVLAGQTPHDTQRFEAKFSSAFQLARQGRYQDATQLFTQLMERAETPAQRAAVQYNLGNIFFTRGLLVSRGNGFESEEAQYLLTQAKIAYQQSLRLDHTSLGASHNLDRVLSLLPEDAKSQDDQDQLGIVMGSIPTGLP